MNGSNMPLMALEPTSMEEFSRKQEEKMRKRENAYQVFLIENFPNDYKMRMEKGITIKGKYYYAIDFEYSDLPTIVAEMDDNGELIALHNNGWSEVSDELNQFIKQEIEKRKLKMVNSKPKEITDKWERQSFIRYIFDNVIYQEEKE